jgi:hypothetical protein
MAQGVKLGEKLGVTLQFTEGEWERELFDRHRRKLPIRAVLPPTELFHLRNAAKKISAISWAYGNSHGAVLSSVTYDLSAAGRGGGDT